MNAISAAVFLIGLAAFGALAWVARGFLERSVDPGAIMVAAVLAAFGLFCLYVAWRVFQTDEPRPVDARAAESPSPRRITISHACSTVGVLLIMLAVLIPESWYPAALLFTGLAFLCAAHVLTPCVERLEKLRQARESMRQL